MMQAGVALYMSYMYMDAYGLGAMSIGIEIMQPSTPTYPRSQEVSGMDMGVHTTM